MDGTVPTGRLPEALRRTGEICASYGLRVANVFHAGDGNMHPLVLYNVNDPAEQEKAEARRRRLLDALRRARRLPHRRARRRHREARPDAAASSAAPISTQQMRVRAVFDPDWLLNPAKVFPLEASAPHETTRSLAPADEAEAAEIVRAARARTAPSSISSAAARAPVSAGRARGRARCSTRGALAASSSTSRRK